MQVKDFKFQTPTVTICECNRLERMYDGSVEKLPEFIKRMRIVYVRVNPNIKNTYMEVMYEKVY